ncbi:kelch repeat and BTB domain-containing protein 11-like [Sceloporus undulatus]|uniref:kelch repeat and BTB domain-containing protein 11-like n=1 Tax=Sceloporus undulatus TaxID=8520 RepID=UPI001C4A768C|nr:kelch repeat and BTB domain-containing protein 11-like [Sceloporus undulatus]
MPRGSSLRAAPFQGLSALSAYLGWTHLAKRLLSWLAVASQAIWSLCPGLWRRPGARQALPEPWQSCPELRVYRGGGGDGDGGAALFTVYTNPYSFQVDLAHLATKSAYFAALSRSRMQEASERRLDLEHVPSASFHAILEWVFFGRFSLAEEDILPAVQSASYLLFSGFLDRCRVALRPWLDPQNCLSYLHFAEIMACPKLRAEVCQFPSAHLLELALPVTGHLDLKLQEELAQLRLAGPPQLCILRKENIAPQDPKKPLLGLYHRPLFPEEGDWHCATQLPFQAEKWSLSTAQLLNYLFSLGGYRERRGARGFAFRAVASRYNPLTGTWMPIAAPRKRRRHFSTAVEGHHIYAIGGWYLDSLLSHDSTTCLYRAVERYDPWTDSWAFVSSLPMGDFSFTVSLSHDLPLCTAHDGFVYALGSIQRTGEKLLLCYDVAADTWQDCCPLFETRADADCARASTSWAAQSHSIMCRGQHSGQRCGRPSTGATAMGSGPYRCPTIKEHFKQPNTDSSLTPKGCFEPAIGQLAKGTGSSATHLQGVAGARGSDQGRPRTPSWPFRGWTLKGREEEGLSRRLPSLPGLGSEYAQCRFEAYFHQKALCQ